MKPLIRLLLLLALAATLITPAVAQQTLTPQAQSQINIARKLINDKRNSAIAYNIKLTKGEKEKFWPLYREYRAKMFAVGDKKIALIAEYANNIDAMNENTAANLLDNYFYAEKKTVKIKQDYARKFRRILPASKVVRLMQIESRMDTMVAMKTAEGIPLME